MPTKPDEGLPVPGDMVQYGCSSRGVVTLRVMNVVDPSPNAGYSEIWFEGCCAPTFNINWTSLYANTGWWKIVATPKKTAVKPREFTWPDAPADLKRVVSMDGNDEVYEWDAIDRIWRCARNLRYTWRDIRDEHPDGVIELIETPYEAAVRYFKGGAALNTARIEAIDHAKAIIEKVVSDA